MSNAPGELERPPRKLPSAYHQRIDDLLKDQENFLCLKKEVAIAKLVLEDAVQMAADLQDEDGKIPEEYSDLLLKVAERVGALVERAAKVEALKITAAGGTHEQQVMRQMLMKQLLESLRQVAPAAVPLIESKWRLLAGSEEGAVAQTALPAEPMEIEVHLRPITRSEDGDKVVSLATTAKLPTALDEEERALSMELAALRKLQDARRSTPPAGNGNGHGNGNGNGHGEKEAV
jgi:hypothetical protein